MRGHCDDVVLSENGAGWQIGKGRRVSVPVSFRPDASVTVIVLQECQHLPSVVVVVAAADDSSHVCTDFEVADREPFVAELEAAAVDTTTQVLPLLDVPNSYYCAPATCSLDVLLEVPTETVGTSLPGDVYAIPTLDA